MLGGYSGLLTAWLGSWAFVGVVLGRGCSDGLGSVSVVGCVGWLGGCPVRCRLRWGAVRFDGWGFGVGRCGRLAGGCGGFGFRLEILPGPPAKCLVRGGGEDPTAPRRRREVFACWGCWVRGLGGSGVGPGHAAGVPTCAVAGGLLRGWPRRRRAVPGVDDGGVGGSSDPSTSPGPTR